MPTKRLPANADIDHLKHQAKDLLADIRKGGLAALQRLREFHPKCGDLMDAEIAEGTYALSDALLTIAREYGYPSWPRLKTAVAEAAGGQVDLIHNDRIEDPVFLQVLDFLDEGDADRLRAHLAAHPGLVNRKVYFEGGNYFTRPTLLEFVAENPIRNGRLPDNIVDIARIILDAGARENQEALDYALGLVASGRVVRECGVEKDLLTLLCQCGADPNAAMHTALAHGEVAAARTLIALGATHNLSTAAALGDVTEVDALLAAASHDQKQLGLALAVLGAQDEIVAKLLKAGADPNRYNPPGGHSHCTPLHSAVWEGHLSTVKVLVDSGARFDIGDIHHDTTAVEWARYAGHDAIVDYFEELSA
ncbi:MAG: ankyrin repeat domain-containing protein [Paracoccaceae bacterium]|nr:ankyrin repeat domain-containing protein [Paracoccaceae bacterium]